MSNFAVRAFISVPAGLLVFVLCVFARQWQGAAASVLDASPPWWLLALHLPLLALSQTLPAFCAGAISGRQGWLIGAAVGAISWVAGNYFAGGSLAYHPFTPSLFRTIVGAATGTAIVAAFAGAAGASLVRRPPPNNSFKPKPLRGSA